MRSCSLKSIAIDIQVLRGSGVVNSFFPRPASSPITNKGSVRNVVQIPRDAGTATSWLKSGELLPGRPRAGPRAGLVSFLKPARGYSGTVQESTFVPPGVNCAIPRQDPRTSSGSRIRWLIVLEKSELRINVSLKKSQFQIARPDHGSGGHFERFRDASSFKVSLIRAVGF